MKLFYLDVVLQYRLWGLFVDFMFFKLKTAYEMRISDWSSDVCSSDLLARLRRLDLWRRLHQVGEAGVDAGAEESDIGHDRAFRDQREGDAAVVADRQSDVEGKRVSVRVDRGGRGII